MSSNNSNKDEEQPIDYSMVDPYKEDLFVSLEYVFLFVAIIFAFTPFSIISLFAGLGFILVLISDRIAKRLIDIRLAIQGREIPYERKQFKDQMWKSRFDSGYDMED